MNAIRLKDCRVVVLAAGQGTRMCSQRAKVLHTLCGRPMIQYSVETALSLSPDRVIVVVGHEADQVRSALSGFPVEFATQAEQQGTGHAVMQALPALEGFNGDVLVFYGDTPLVAAGEFTALTLERRRSGADLALLVTHVQVPAGYGRIVRSGSEIERIVEERDATSQEQELTEINPGIYCFTASALRAVVANLDNRNLQGEYYLTDAVGLLRQTGRKVVAVSSPAAQNLLGINTRVELAEAEKKLYRRRANEFMLEGVTILDPETFFASYRVRIGPDTVIYPNVVLEGTTEIGQGVIIFPNTRIIDSRIGPDARIMDSCLISESEVGARTSVGPFAHLRRHTRIGSNCRVGNFVEVKNSTLGDKTKSAHLSYLGDTQIGNNVNIGAGTITCNYDGFSKNRTQIGDGAFIGSGTELVAPVTVGQGAYVAAGSAITEDVPPDSLGIARARQVNKEGWTKKQRETDKQKADD